MSQTKVHLLKTESWKENPMLLYSLIPDLKQGDLVFHIMPGNSYTGEKYIFTGDSIYPLKWPLPRTINPLNWHHPDFWMKYPTKQHQFSFDFYIPLSDYFDDFAENLTISGDSEDIDEFWYTTKIRIHDDLFPITFGSCETKWIPNAIKCIPLFLQIFRSSNCYIRLIMQNGFFNFTHRDVQIDLETPDLSSGRAQASGNLNSLFELYRDKPPYMDRDMCDQIVIDCDGSDDLLRIF